MLLRFYGDNWGFNLGAYAAKLVCVALSGLNVPEGRNIPAWRRKPHLIMLFFCFISSLPTFSQQLYFSRYASGNFIEDNRHELEIFNESDDYQNLAGYIIVTRNYVVRLPERTILPPLSRIRLGKESTTRSPKDIEYFQLKDFMVRIALTEDEGDYVLLFDREQNIVDAFYFSPSPNVDFLPSELEFIDYAQERINLFIPNETQADWEYLQISPDPVMSFVRIQKDWNITARNRNLYPAATYGELTGKYVQGIVKLEWETLLELDCFFHQVERSKDGRNFEQIGEVDARKNTAAVTNYVFYDDKVLPNESYIYRVKTVDKFGNEAQTKAMELSTQASSEDFSMEVIRFEEELSVRFFSKKPQAVRVKLLDEQFREVALLFYEEVEAESRNLIRYHKELPLGKYYVIAVADARRFYEEVEVK